MASELDDFDQSIENLRTVVRKSFARIYAALKARELKTLRQLDAIRKQCQDDKELNKNCVQNIRISYENESSLLNEVNNYGVIDFEKLNLDSNVFTLEDYVSPNDDHMYSYKTIDELTKEEVKEDLEAIEEAALKQITNTDNCVCYVHIRTDEVSKKFRDINTPPSPIKCVESVPEENNADCTDNNEDEKSDSSESDKKKINPTDDWLNSIKNQTETEPTQVADVMEHSTITCS